MKPRPHFLRSYRWDTLLDGAEDSGWRWSPFIFGALFVLIVAGLACDWFEPEFWRSL